MDSSWYWPVTFTTAGYLSDALLLWPQDSRRLVVGEQTGRNWRGTMHLLDKPLLSQ